MCGINGIIDYHKHYTKEERNSLVHRMNDKIIYRGPNMEGLFDSEYVTLGMRRLSIIDLSTGKQPIYNEKKTIAIVFNKSIFAYLFFSILFYLKSFRKYSLIWYNTIIII